MSGARTVAPHYLRFARALTLVSSASIAGCYQAHQRDVDVGPVDAAAPDVPDGGPCARCTCGTFTGDGTCNAMGLSFCCPIVGPLAPPDLSSSGPIRGPLHSD